MIKHIKSLILIFLVTGFGLSSCKKTEYSFGELKTPSGLTLTTTIAGQNTANPNGDGTGKVTITTSASDVITYKIDFGDGTVQLVPSGTIEYKYTNPGTADYTVTVNAVGTGGVVSTVSKKIKVYVAFEIPANILAGLTGGASKIWVTDKETSGHVGVGQADLFFSNYYSADPNSRNAFLYDDEITFTKGPNNTIQMTVDNKGLTSMIGAATAFYGFSGGDGGYPLDTQGTKNLAFSNATSGSTAAVSTQIQFKVPGNGIINFGTGGTTYEIISLTATQVTLRNIGIDGLAWYQKLKVKP